jgi:RimJ/RimL family protein N-acetyltransferase
MGELGYPEPGLGDEVVLLRAWRESDLPAVLGSMNDPLLLRYTAPTGGPYTEEEARGFFAEQERERLRGVALNFALAEPADPGAVLGGGSVYDVDTHLGRAGVGYWLTPQARGRGVATHAVRLMARWAFSDLGTARLELTCSPDNVASQRVAERAGFVREGVLRSHLPYKGARRDSVMFSLLPGELG